MNRTDLHTAFTSWEHRARMPRDNHPDSRLDANLDPHLGTQALHQLSRESGLAKAEPWELAHLSQCPDCLDKWEILCFLETDDAADTSTYAVLGFGRLKAAASSGTDRLTPRVLTSGCGRFKLGLFPEPGQPDRGMVTLDLLGEIPKRQQARATVKDAAGRTLLSARLVQGRAAAKISGFSDLDLSLWTVSVR